MEQFNRTITTITGNANAASGALEELKGITKGTAYGLDAAAKATQNFVTPWYESGIGDEVSGRLGGCGSVLRKRHQ